ncbi:MAG: biopolymer transporter ExbD [Lentisphaeria bacterium]
MSANRHLHHKIMTTIDMTPLMDLTFVLLIIFVITVPVMEYITDVTPPELNGKTSVETIEKPFVISLNHAGEIFLDKEKVAMYDLQNKLTLMRQQKGDFEIMLRADGTRPYEEIVAIMRVAQKAGVKSVSLMTSAEKFD